MKVILVDAVNTFVLAEHGIFEPMRELLDTYPNRKIILTNANNEQSKKFGLDNMPYELFTLKHDPEKTDPKYYQLMLQHFKLKKEDVLYFEHNPDAVKSAQSQGITTYHYGKEEKDLEKLKAFLDNNLENQ